MEGPYTFIYLAVVIQGVQGHWNTGKVVASEAGRPALEELFANIALHGICMGIRGATAA